MFSSNNKIKVIKNIILRGFVRHSQIKPEIAKAELLNINPDDISQLSIDYKTRGNKITQRINKSFFSFINKIATLGISILCGLIYAETTAAKIFSETILKNKLTGFGDNLRYWLGLKKIELSGADVFNSVFAMLKATPLILKNFFIGFAAGLILWIFFIFILGFIYRRKKLKNQIINLLKKNGY